MQNSTQNDIHTEELTAEEEAELLGISTNEPLLSAHGDGVFSTQGDGVFSNLSAKPTKEFEELEPPSYADAVADPSPSYFDTSITGISDDGEILVEGFPVGDYVALFINIFISFSFDLLGFLLTSLLASSHAAKAGSQIGLGLTMMRFGSLIKREAAEGKLPPPEYDNRYPVDPEEEKQRQEWSANLLMFFGIFVMARSLVEYFRIRKMKSVIEASSSIVTS